MHVYCLLCLLLLAAAAAAAAVVVVVVAAGVKAEATIVMVFFKYVSVSHISRP